MNQKIVLFDLDGVLVKVDNSAHIKSFSFGIKKVFGINADISEINYSGKTDTKIVLELLKLKGINEVEAKKSLSEIFKFMIDYVKGYIRNSNVGVLDGVRNLLKELKNKGFILGLVTGNLKEIAKLKLEKINLWDLFETGGFGERSDVRSKLIEEALNQLNSNIVRDNVYYIGDTPLDIECGKEAKVNTIAIATGKYSTDELKKCNPDFVLDDLSNIQQILNILSN